jgi:hypothetical protein
MVKCFSCLDTSGCGSDKDRGGGVFLQLYRRESALDSSIARECEGEIING